MKRQCAKCGGTKNLSRHHMFPVVHFGRQNNRVVVYLCRKPCHDDMEHLISQNEGLSQNGQRRKRSRQFYMDLFLQFLMT